MGNVLNALFKYKVGQRVYLIASGRPVVIFARFRHDEASYYEATSIDGKYYRVREVSIQYTNPRLWKD